MESKSDAPPLDGPWRGEIDVQGRLILPAELVSRYGWKPGMKVRLDEIGTGLRLRQPVHHLAKVYIEPTNICNLECRTCLRNSWEEPPGRMNPEVFSRILEGLRSFCPPPTVFFGGLGEPFAHPQIIEMVTRAKSLGGPVELITNGTMLTRELSRRLIEAGLDRLWVSLDGATPASYADVRLGAVLPEVLANLAAFREERWQANLPKPELGIVFVAMKRNIADLPAVQNLGYYLGARRLLVTNLLPYTAEMRKEILYERVGTSRIFQSSLRFADLQLPKMDLNEATREPLYRTLRGSPSASFAGVHFEEGSDFCPFIEAGATAIRWDGGLSPCLPLLRDHISFSYISHMGQSERFSRQYTVGRLEAEGLEALWNNLEYAAFRERVQSFDFSFCTSCGGCDLSEKNEEDCFGSLFPTCGGCLRAQGIIRCP